MSENTERGAGCRVQGGGAMVDALTFAPERDARAVVELRPAAASIARCSAGEDDADAVGRGESFGTVCRASVAHLVGRFGVGCSVGSGWTIRGRPTHHHPDGDAKTQRFQCGRTRMHRIEAPFNARRFVERWDDDCYSKERWRWVLGRSFRRNHHRLVD